jgi:hypothetical protein
LGVAVGCFADTTAIDMREQMPAINAFTVCLSLLLTSANGAARLPHPDGHLREPKRVLNNHAYSARACRAALSFRNSQVSSGPFADAKFVCVSPRNLHRSPESMIDFGGQKSDGETAK